MALDGIKWDIEESSIVKKSHERPIQKLSGVASSTVSVVFAVLVVAGAPAPAERGAMDYTTEPEPIVEQIQISRRDLMEPKESKSPPTDSEDSVDTRIGMSSNKLADLFPRLFQPISATESGEEEEFFLR